MKNLWFWVFKKEMRELLRDKRARSAALIGPAFSVALFLVLFGVIGSSVKSARKPAIHLAGPVSPSDPLVAALKAAKFDLKTVGTVAEGEALLRKGDARLVLSFPDDPKTTILAGRSETIEARYDPNEQRGQIALATVQATASGLNLKIVEGVLKGLGADPAAATPLKLAPKEITLAGKTNDILVSILPYLVVIWAFYGGFSMASDIVAGEKERQTLETLLTTPVARRQVALGKLATLITLCTVSSLTAVLTLAVFAALNLPLTKSVFADGFGLTPAALGVAVLCVVPLAAMFGALLLAVSAFARNTREAQTYLAQMSILVLIPAVFSQIIGLTEAAGAKWVYLVPVLNVSASIRAAMLGRIVPADVLTTVAVSIALAALALVVAVRLFGKEEVLTRI